MGHSGAVQSLLAGGASSNPVDYVSRQMCYHKKYKPVLPFAVLYLLRLYSPPSRAQSGATPADHAASRGHDGVTGLLQPGAPGPAAVQASQVRAAVPSSGPGGAPGAAQPRAVDMRGLGGAAAVSAQGQLPPAVRVAANGSAPAAQSFPAVAPAPAPAVAPGGAGGAAPRAVDMRGLGGAAAVSAQGQLPPAVRVAANGSTPAASTHGTVPATQVAPAAHYAGPAPAVAPVSAAGPGAGGAKPRAVDMKGLGGAAAVSHQSQLPPAVRVAGSVR
jgi:hypothetical protein